MLIVLINISYRRSTVQIYAYDEEGIETIAHLAVRSQKYYCPDCHQKLSFRSSPYIRAHFFHLKDQNPCYRSSKSLTHLEVQAHLVEKLPLGEAKQERYFPSIHRRADVCWENKKIVFEVQISFITYEEVKARIEDYNSCGYEVVWILHLQRFSRYMTTAAELYLRDHTHYFTSINQEGLGAIFDQFNIIIAGRREATLFRKPIDIAHPSSALVDEALPQRIKDHRQSWALSFAGDLLQTKKLSFEHLQKLYELEQLELTRLSKPTWQKSILSKVKDFFRLMGYILLDAI